MDVYEWWQYASMTDCWKWKRKFHRMFITFNSCYTGIRILKLACVFCANICVSSFDRKSAGNRYLFNHEIMKNNE